MILTRWLEWCERFDSLAVRERLLITGSFLACVYLLIDVLIISPLDAQGTRAASQLSEVQGSIEQIAIEKQVFDRVSQKDPDANIKREKLKLQGRLFELETELDNLSLHLIPSQRIPEILQSISKEASSVRLKSLKTLPPDIIDVGSKTAQIIDAAKNKISNAVDGSQSTTVVEHVYRHAIRIKFEADYFSTIKFLAALEALQWRFYWSGMNYQVVKYPTAEVDIEIYTLSTSAGLLGEPNG